VDQLVAPAADVFVNRVEISGLRNGTTVEQWNDALATEHDIDEYYAQSNPVVRTVEELRLRRIRALIGPKPNERMLEVGCGGGHVLQRFPECDLVGVDVSGSMLEKARTRLAGLRVELHKGELRDLDLAPESFDAIVCTEVLEHVVDPGAVLAGIAGLLKPTGRAVVTFPNDSLIIGAKRVLTKSRASRLPLFRRTDWGGDRYHLHAWTLDEMRSLLRRSFEISREGHVPSRLVPVRYCFLVRPRRAA
jgi:SAM-dependent methyltransferase